MSILTVVQRSGLRAAGLAAIALSFTATPAQAHMIPVADLVRGISMNQAQCAAIPSTVWVTVTARSYCMRYYLSTVGGEGPRPVVFLQGDRLGTLEFKTGNFALGKDQDLHPGDFIDWPKPLSNQTKR